MGDFLHTGYVCSCDCLTFAGYGRRVSSNTSSECSRQIFAARGGHAARLHFCAGCARRVILRPGFLAYSTDYLLFQPPAGLCAESAQHLLVLSTLAG